MTQASTQAKEEDHRSLPSAVAWRCGPCRPWKLLLGAIRLMEGCQHPPPQAGRPTDTNVGEELQGRLWSPALPRHLRAPHYVLFHVQVTQLVEHLPIGRQGPLPEDVD